MREDSGFTLIEIVICLSVVSILSLSSIYGVKKVQGLMHKHQFEMDVKNINYGLLQCEEQQDTVVNPIPTPCGIDDLCKMNLLSERICNHEVTPIGGHYSLKSINTPTGLLNYLIVTKHSIKPTQIPIYEKIGNAYDNLDIILKVVSDDKPLPIPTEKPKQIITANTPLNDIQFDKMTKPEFIDLPIEIKKQITDKYFDELPNDVKSSLSKHDLTDLPEEVQQHWYSWILDWFAGWFH